MVISLTKDNFAREVKESSKPVVIDVFATWCGPCQMMKPFFEEVAKELGDKYTFAQINVDESRELAIDFGVTSVPTFIFIKNNEIVGKETGYMPKDQLKAKISELLG